MDTGSRLDSEALEAVRYDDEKENLISDRSNPAKGVPHQADQP